MEIVHLVAMFSVLQFFFFGYMTGLARRDSGLKAPAVTGHEGFERMYRVQVNSMESLVVFLPSLLIAGNYWSPTIVAGLGMIYIIGRFIYWRAYVSEPSTRGTGFILSMIPTAILIFLTIVGILLSLFS